MGQDEPRARDPLIEADRSSEGVREVYREIATHFSKTRSNPWPEVESFCTERAGRPGGIGLDLGCGNGRHMQLLGTLDRVVGVDLSRPLLREAKSTLSGDPPAADQAKSWDLLQGDAARIPIREGVIDVGLYVATLHHLPDRQTRLESLRELSRVLTPNGTALVSVWSTAHDRFDSPAERADGFDTSVDWTLPGGKTVPRCYHIYAPQEFRRDLQAAGLSIESHMVSSGNCYAEVRSG
jgi:SAM-dependent methyltransferase